MPQRDDWRPTLDIATHRFQFHVEDLAAPRGYAEVGIVIAEHYPHGFPADPVVPSGESMEEARWKAENIVRQKYGHARRMILVRVRTEKGDVYGTPEAAS